jgi:Ca2+-binding EF-hand superfamily protein
MAPRNTKDRDGATLASWGILHGIFPSRNSALAAGFPFHPTMIMKTTIPITIPLAGLFAAAAAIATADPAPEPREDQPPPIDRLFDRLDTNKDGVLSREEFRAIRPQERPGNPPGQPPAVNLERLFAAADTDGDGLLSPEEFAAGKFPRKGPEVFRRLDRDGDGFLSLDELRNREQPPPPDRPEPPERPVRPRPPEQPGPRPPIEIFRKLDTDDSGTLTFDEFKAMAGNAGNADKLQVRFNRLDSDGDGVLTLDEFARRNRPRAEDGPR